MGHIALVVEIPATWPDKAAWAKLSMAQRGLWMQKVKCIDCAAAFTRKISGYAVGTRDATLWNKPDSKFVAWKSQTRSTDYPREAPAPTPAMAQPKLGDRLLKLGMSGPDVAQLQVILGLTPDGIFGPLTDTIVRGVQRTYRLAVDGEVGPATLAKLRA